jgi:hypothetical protein
MNKAKSKRLLGNKQGDCFKVRKGRSTDLIHLRNIKIVKVFYKLSEIDRRRLDDVLLIMETQEFFLCQRTIWDIIRANTDMLDALSRGESIDETLVKQTINQLALEI